LSKLLEDVVYIQEKKNRFVEAKYKMHPSYQKDVYPYIYIYLRIYLYREREKVREKDKGSEVRMTTAASIISFQKIN